MYVRPDSDRIPKYLANSGVKFCGHGRNLSPADSVIASLTASADASSMQGENSSGKWKENGFIGTWASGFLMGIAARIRPPVDA
jgi:hypothetical protein